MGQKRVFDQVQGSGNFFSRPRLKLVPLAGAAFQTHIMTSWFASYGVTMMFLGPDILPQTWSRGLGLLWGKSVFLTKSRVVGNFFSRPGLKPRPPAGAAFQTHIMTSWFASYGVTMMFLGPDI